MFVPSIKPLRCATSSLSSANVTLVAASSKDPSRWPSPCWVDSGVQEFARCRALAPPRRHIFMAPGPRSSIALRIVISGALRAHRLPPPFDSGSSHSVEDNLFLT
ncbi:hypothetical protein FB451DRAFT_1561169 [Mycena latifolia]|nr:hypothetical protein FB451DRAFT_1561169 [Mycena latifolia]